MRARVQGAILQGAVSDREMLTMYDDTPQRIEAATKLVETGRGKDCLPFEMSLFGAAMSATRFLSLAVRGGQDDYFSSDLSDEELKTKLGPLNVPTLVVFSEDDEAVPMWVDKQLLLKRMCAAMPKATGQMLPGDHSLHGKSEQFVALVMDFLTKNFPTSQILAI
eukprot:m.21036 g.21036  ORF g.21036 m.21036 type:complete len:165 (+) comp8862_c0_seq1:202-696(+)